MISRRGFHVGQRVRFQNFNRVWTQGEVVSIEPPDWKVIGPGGTVTEVKPAKVTIAYRNGLKGGWTEITLPTKRVQAVEEAKEA